MFKQFITYLILVFSSYHTLAQNNYPYGNINVRFFDSKEYNAESQNWDITQNKDGLIIIANNKNTLLYDGDNWSSVKLNNKDVVKSVKTINGVTYVGGYSEFGKVSFDSKGTFSYKKLSPEVSNGFDYILKAFNTANFISKNEFYTLRNDTTLILKKLPDNFPIKSAIEFKGNIILHSKNTKNIKKDCFLYNGKQFFKIKKSNHFNPKAYFSFNAKDYLISKKGIVKEITSNNNNFYLMPTTIIKSLVANNKDLDIYSISIKNNIIAVGTDGDGIYLYTIKGNLIRHISKNDGLTNLQIRKLFFDKSNNLWAAVDNGIYLIDLSNPITSFNSENGITSTIEDIAFNGDKAYLLTHADLFESEIKNNKKHFVNTNLFKVELWKMANFTFSDGTNRTLVVSNNGLEFLINKKRKIKNDMIIWDLVQSENNPNLIWYGLDNGIGYSIYHPESKSLTSHYLKNTTGQVRNIISSKGQIYYTSRKNGIVKLDSTKTQNDNLITKGLTPLKDTLLNYEDYTICDYKSKIYVGTNHGLYYLDNNSYIPINDVLTKPRLYIHRLFNDNNEKLWTVTFQETKNGKEYRTVGYLDNTTKDAKLYSIPFKSLSEDIIQVINKDNKGNLWFGGKSKLYIYNDYKNLNLNDSIQTLITKISVNDSVIYNYYNFSIQKDNTLKWEDNTITFNFASPSYIGMVKNTYSFYLDGWDKEWSDWNTLTEKKYERLEEGTYIFHVKAKNYYNSESLETTFEFSIKPPWHRTIWAYIAYFMLVLAAIYYIIKLSVKRVKDQNEKLEKIVEERTAEVEKQKDEIEHKNKDIVDSIIYAKRIQDTILPSIEKAKTILKNHFVIFKPKDIVSGDFYWIEELDGKAYFSAIDCTGHGVPGAFVSIVGFNGIKRTVNEFKERQPSKILDKLRDIVINTFTTTDAHLKDGMDMTLCSLDYKTLKLEFSGANNPLIIIRDGVIIETKGNKQPIGDFEFKKPFTNHKIQLIKGDSIFMFTDGYADQFGGPKGKKFKLKTLKNLLLEVSNLPIDQQEEKLEETFNNWKGMLEQLDDVCLIGLKI